MKSILFAIFFCAACTVSFAQVSDMQFILNYNCTTNLYEVGINIAEGEANTISTRAQFNAQVTVVVPTGSEVEIIELLNPIVNNQAYNGTQPQDWINATPALSPAATPDLDYHPFQPRLNPAAFYNDLSEGDQVILFTLRIGNGESNDETIRLYDNETDISAGSGDFRNGFTLGSPIQIYNGNIRQVCGESTSSTNDVQSDFEIFPNPVTDILTIKTAITFDGISIIDLAGRTLIEDNKSGNSLDVSKLKSGTYLLILSHNGIIDTQRFVKF